MKSIMQFWKPATFFLALYGVFWLPKDIEDSGEAALVWQRWLAMIDQNTALWFLALVALAYILWIDFRPTWRKRRSKRDIKWAASKTRFTIKEAACFVKSVSLSAFETESEVQAFASELRHYVSQGLVDSYAEKNESHSRPGGPKQRINVTLNTFLASCTVHKIKEEGLSRKLPLIDDLNQTVREILKS